MTMDTVQMLVGDEPQLFVDNVLIEATHALTRRWHRPVRDEGGPVLRKDRPWEDKLYFTYSNYGVLEDPADGLLKCWYEDLGAEPGHGFHSRLLYATSRDGLRWDKPELDVVEIEGRRTNIVMGHAPGGRVSEVNAWAESGVHSNAVGLDPCPADPAKRFRTVFSHCVTGADGGRRHDSAVAYSADGMHWFPEGQRPSFGSSGHQLSDVSTLWFDPDSKLWVMNTRHGGQYGAALPGNLPPTSRWFKPVYPHRADLMSRRRIWQTRTHDFVHWTDPICVVAPDDHVDNIDEAFYGMAQFRVGRVYFGLLGVFSFTDNVMHVRLVHSRDMVNWTMADRGQPLLAPRGEGHWDAWMVSMTSPPIERDGEWLFFHGGSGCHHDWWMSPQEELTAPEAVREPELTKFGMGVARMRQQGFCSLDAGPQRAGWVITRPMRSPGRTLEINARCGPGGWITAEVTDGADVVLEGRRFEDGDAFTGDALNHTFTWGGESDLDPWEGWRFRKVCFRMRNASLYSFRWV